MIIISNPLRAICISIILYLICKWTEGKWCKVKASIRRHVMLWLKLDSTEIVDYDNRLKSKARLVGVFCSLIFYHILSSFALFLSNEFRTHKKCYTLNVYVKFEQSNKKKEAGFGFKNHCFNKTSILKVEQSTKRRKIPTKISTNSIVFPRHRAQKCMNPILVWIIFCFFWTLPYKKGKWRAHKMSFLADRKMWKQAVWTHLWRILISKRAQTMPVYFIIIQPKIRRESNQSTFKWCKFMPKFTIKPNFKPNFPLCQNLLRLFVRPWFFAPIELFVRTILLMGERGETVYIIYHFNVLLNPMVVFNRR